MRTDLLVNDFVYKTMTEGVLVLFQSQFKRNYIHVRDIARTFLFCIENYDKMNGEVFKKVMVGDRFIQLKQVL